MRVKISLLALVASLGPWVASAQTSDAEAEAVVNLLGVQKKEAIAKLVPVFGKDSVAFWKIYDEYQQGNRATAKDRLHLYEGTAMSYQRMNPRVADSLAQLYFSNRMEQEKNLQIYYNKIKTATNAVVAFEFYQAEVYLLTMIRAQIMRQIPTYGSLQPAPGR
ncbi:MAG TPA: hypothetical protein VNU70_06015 [Puia sp.]|jgi:hypothetical protein|nr:hypothetical protein [Puia sp.]